MQNVSKTLAGVGVVAGIIAAGYAVYWFGTRDARTTLQPPPPAEVVSAPEHAAPSSETRTFVQPRTDPVQVVQTPSPATNPPEIAPVVAVSPSPTNVPNLITNWEDKVDDILGSEGDDTNKVQQLLAMFSRLPPDGQTEVAQHLSNLVADEDYKQIVPLLLNTNLSAPVLDEFFNDLLNRPNAEKLPLLLDIARNPNHPNAGDAKDLLELYLDEDYGGDWVTWRQKLEAWLKENPD